jgi:hypothetical protein
LKPNRFRTRPKCRSWFFKKLIKITMKKQTGIWIDLRDAYIVALPVLAEGTVSVKHLRSDIEESAATGGTRSKTPWGPQGGDMKRSAQERRHHEEKIFFERVLESLHPETNELVIFGPSEAKHGLANVLAERGHSHTSLSGIESADKMTQPQMEAWVRTYFERPAPRRLPK